MDDYSISSLTESKNEWCARLVSILTHHIAIGIESIFDEALKLCVDNDEESKYLMTFQNLLSAIPSWNQMTVEAERKRIETTSGCKYLEDLITCVHIIQLKALTCIRVGQKQKKIDIDIPSLDKFIHNIYINVARKLYTNIYLFEQDLYPLQVQKNKHELEILIKEAILSTIRDNIPVERILQCYMEENEEIEVPKQTLLSDNKDDNKNDNLENNTTSSVPVDISLNKTLSESRLDEIATTISENNKNEMEKPKLVENNSSISENIVLKLDDKLNEIKTPDKINEIENKGLDNIELSNIKDKNVIEDPSLSINFSNNDMIVESTGKEVTVEAPKDISTLNKIAEVNNAKRKAEEEDESQDKISIGEDISLDLSPINLDVVSL